MSSWTFSRKLAVAFAAVAVLTLAMGAVSLYALVTVTAGKDSVIYEVTPDLLDAQRLRNASRQEIAALRGMLLTGEPGTAEAVAAADRYSQEIDAGARQFAAALEEIRGRQFSDRERQLLGEVEKARAAHAAGLGKVLALRNSGAPMAEVNAALEGEVLRTIATLEEHLDAFVDAKVESRDSAARTASDIADSARVGLIAIGLVAVALAMVLGIFLTRSLTRQIGGAVQNVRSASAELKTTAAQQASGAKEQATAMSEVATTVSELLASSRQIAQSAQRVASVARDATDAARAGDQSVESAQQTVIAIRQQVEVIVQHMLGLGKKSQQIGGILEIINELADQTNILAINATIEAAGAGEAGRRFAVVGEEIRKLADRVGGSTREIRELIEEIRSAVNSTVMATESGAKTVEVGSERFGELTAAFRRIAEIIETTTEAAREIELSTKQQSTAVEQVNVAVGDVAQATREAETGASQTVQTASELAALSDRLTRLVQSERAA
jgi:methyl-accepting chemotaxis protein